MEFPLDDLLQATHPSLGRPGMAMILRALDRGGEAAGRTMVSGLLRDPRPHAGAVDACMDVRYRVPGSIPAIIETAKTRPLSRDEVAEYLRVIKSFCCAARWLPCNPHFWRVEYAVPAR